MHTIKLGAINIHTNQYEIPLYASKESIYQCPSCKKGVFLRKGKVLRPHFAHYISENPCTFYEHPGESEIHQHAKELIRHAHTLGREICIETKCLTCKEKELLSLPPIDIHLEYRFDYGGPKIADIAFVENGEIQSIVEICNTHSTKDEHRPEPWCEVRAKDTIDAFESIDEIIIPCIRQKRCQPCEENYVKQHFKELDSKPNAWFLHSFKELEWYIRYSLGQRDFTKIPYEEHWRLRQITGHPRSHLTFDFDARHYGNGNTHNTQILDIFRRFYIHYKPLIYSHKGMLLYSIVRPNITEYTGENEVDTTSEGTVSILCSIIIDILKKSISLM